MESSNIKLMYWYMKVGRFIYGLLFAAATIITVVLLLVKSRLLFPSILLDIAFGAVGVAAESKLSLYRHYGTEYVETDKSENTYELVELRTKGEAYFIGEIEDEYFLKLPQEAFFMNYKKGDVMLEENPSINSPIIEISTIKKTSRRAENEYRAFGVAGEKIKTSTQRIVVRDQNKDIKRDLKKKEDIEYD